MRIFQIGGLLLCLSLLILNVESKFKSLHCNAIDKDYGDFTSCRIKAINRNRNSINLDYVQKQYSNDLTLHFQFFKRLNGWRPFLYNYKVDLCAFQRSANNIVLKIFFEYLSPFTNFNHTCPLLPNETFRVFNFELDIDNLRMRFPIDNGEYAMHMIWYHKKVARLTINGSILYYNYKEP